MTINCNHCILFFPEVSYCYSGYNIPPTICGHLLFRTLGVLDQFEPSLGELMPSPVPSFRVGCWRSLMHGDLCCFCNAIVVEGSTKAEHRDNCMCFTVETPTEYIFCNASLDCFGTVSSNQLHNKPLESIKNSIYQRVCVSFTDL